VANNPQQSTSTEDQQDVPVIDMKLYFEKGEGWEAECKKVSDSLHKFGILIVRDPRVNHEHNSTFIDMVEQYFEKVGNAYYAGEELVDARPELSYQTGVTPASKERARNHKKIVEAIDEDNKPMSPFPPELDAKWRFFWPIGERPAELKDELPCVIPEGFPDWERNMNTWGNFLVDAAYGASEMAAVGMGLDSNTFTERMRQGPHLLAPTASDLEKHDVGTPLAGFHYDLNWLTIHGKSRFPGLYVWLRNWKKLTVKIPDGCLIMQAGIMFEHLTGGYVLAGYHEVMYTEATKAAMLRVMKEMEETGNKRILWRISSTLFSHLRYNVDLTPLKEMSHLIDQEQAKKYGNCTAWDKLCEELQAIELAPK
jgi:isopenicillin N synthase-like dioxygenase